MMVSIIHDFDVISNHCVYQVFSLVWFSHHKKMVQIPHLVSLATLFRCTKLDIIYCSKSHIIDNITKD